MCRFPRFTAILFCLAATLPLAADDAVSGDTRDGVLWIRLDVTEPGKENHAVDTHAQIPYDVALIVIGAVPAQYRQQVKDEGFDLAQIHKKTVALEPDTQFTEKAHGYQVVIKKEKRENDDAEAASILKLKIEDLGMDLKLPLAMAPYIVTLLTKTFDELDGLDEPLARVVSEIQKLPPGKYVSATDGYSSFEIELE